MDDALRVLILDDQPSDAELSAHLIGSGGYPCTWLRVESEAEFREGLRGFRPDLILSDFTLPGYDGLSALEVAMSEAPLVPFIFVSGSIGGMRASEALGRGAVGYVPKDGLSGLVPAVTLALNQARSLVSPWKSVTAATRLRRLTSILDVLSRVRVAAAAEGPAVAVLQEGCHLLHVSGHYEYAFVAIAEAATRKVRVVSCAGLAAKRGHSSKTATTSGPELGASLTGRVLRTGEPLVQLDAAEYRGPLSEHEEALLQAGGSVLAFPLRANAVVHGALVLGAAKDAGISEPEMLLLEKLAGELASAARALGVATTS